MIAQIGLLLAGVLAVEDAGHVRPVERAETVLLVSGAPKKPEPDDAAQGGTSAAVAGRFDALPPSANAYPTDLLLTMRAKLTGEHNLPKDSDHAKDSGNGH